MLFQSGNAIRALGGVDITNSDYFSVVVAGLAGQTPHMISATVLALSRLLYEFRDDLEPVQVQQVCSSPMSKDLRGCF